MHSEGFRENAGSLKSFLQPHETRASVYQTLLETWEDLFMLLILISLQGFPPPIKVIGFLFTDFNKFYFNPLSPEYVYKVLLHPVLSWSHFYCPSCNEANGHELSA